MKTVCFVINNIGDYHAARIRCAAERFAARGYALIAIEASDHSHFYAHKQKRAAQLRSAFKVIRLPAGSMRTLPLRVFRALGALKPSFLFTIGYSDPLALSTLAYAKLRRVPIAFMADSKADDQPRSPRAERLKSLILRRFDAALVAGRRHSDYFRSLGLKGPIEIGYDVIDADFFVSQANRLSRKRSLFRRCGILPSQPYVICVSRLVPRKNVPLALQIFSESGLGALGYKFMLVGQGPELERINAAVKAAGLSDAFVHHNNVPNHLMPLLYQEAAALLLTSEYDQWGLCVNEAMAVGTPCFVTRRCGVADEMVRHRETGFVIEPGDVAGTAAELRRIATDEELRARLSKACRDESSRWSLDGFAAAMLRIAGADLPAGTQYRTN